MHRIVHLQVEGMADAAVGVAYLPQYTAGPVLLLSPSIGIHSEFDWSLSLAQHATNVRLNGVNAKQIWLRSPEYLPQKCNVID